MVAATFRTRLRECAEPWTSIPKTIFRVHVVLGAEQGYRLADPLARTHCLDDLFVGLDHGVPASRWRSVAPCRGPGQVPEPATRNQGPERHV